MLGLIGFALFFLRKGRGLNMPRIRKASGPMSLFDPQEGRLDPEMEAVAVKRPLLYVRDPPLSLSAFLTGMAVFPGSFEPSDVFAGSCRTRKTLA